jgi:hypothetical protein
MHGKRASAALAIGAASLASIALARPAYAATGAVSIALARYLGWRRPAPVQRD